MRKVTAAQATRRRSGPARRRVTLSERCQRKFRRYFPGGFDDPQYVDWERGYKWRAHEQWEHTLARPEFQALLKRGRFEDVARRAVTIESRTNLLFSFEKMALRDAVRPRAGAREFATGLYQLLYGRGSDQFRFARWVDVVASLPRRQTRVLTWPLVTIYPFLAQPATHMFLKPMVTRRAATAYGFAFEYRSRPNWTTYQSLLAFAERVRCDQHALHPKDMIDVQSFIWVQGSDEYPD